MLQTLQVKRNGKTAKTKVKLWDWTFVSHYMAWLKGIFNRFGFLYTLKLIWVFAFYLITDKMYRHHLQHRQALQTYHVRLVQTSTICTSRYRYKIIYTTNVNIFMAPLTDLGVGTSWNVIIKVNKTKTLHRLIMLNSILLNKHTNPKRYTMWLDCTEFYGC